MKYVIVGSFGIETARLGSEVDGHLDLVCPGQRVLSAGYCTLFVGPDAKIKAHVWGHSHALEVESRGQEDEEIIEKTISFRGA